MLLSTALEVVEEEQVLHHAARIKCERSIALADCHAIALAQKLKATAVFARQGDDLAKEMKRKPFPIRLYFLETQRRPQEHQSRSR